jgi:two-component system, LytTR family, response regulator
MKTDPIITLIVEDNHEATALLEMHLLNFPDVQVIASVKNVDEATLAYLKYRPRLVLLDVELEDRTGFEFLDNIRGIAGNLTLIFITAFDHYAIEAIKYSAFDYLMKPVDPVELAASLEKCRKKHTQEDFDRNLNLLHQKLNKTQHLKLTVKHGFIWLKISDILYCQADWNYTRIYLTDGKSHLITMNIGQLEKKIPAADFIRANRSLILNVNYLQQVDKEKEVCIMKSDKEVKVLSMTGLKIRKLENILDKRMREQ